MPRTLLCLAAGSAALVLGATIALAGTRDKLWEIVHETCWPAAGSAALPAPCQAVDSATGTVVIKDLRGIAQLLALPAMRVRGMDDPVILTEPAAAATWAAGWKARPIMEKLLGRPLPRDWTVLAVNSAYGRSQDQLHIHVDCVSPDIHARLAQLAPVIGENWSRPGLSVNGHDYAVRQIAGDTLDGIDPVALVARGLAGAKADLGRWTVVVVGATLADGRPGFHVMAGAADPASGNFGHGEEMQDHGCRLDGGS